MDQKNAYAETESSPFLQKHSALLRIWHWLTFLTLTASIVTVLIASTALHPRENIKLVQERLAKKGVTITDEQAFSVSHAFDDKMWDVHKLLGFGLAFLLLSRVILEVVQPGDEKVKVRIRQALKLKTQTTGNQKLIRHFLIVKRGYLLFYVLLLVMVLTGLGMAFGHDLAFLDHYHRTIKTIHSFCQYLIYSFVVLHLAGVIVSDITHSRGIVSGMINGGDRNKG